MGYLLLYIFLFYILFIFPKYIKFKNSNYGNISGNSFLKTIFNKGIFGEFLTFYYLEKLPIYKKLLTNVYIQKEDGTTTEIDLIMICENGIYVFESKNYSGWIFGDEKSKNWVQTLKNGEKNYFYNPIWQNKGHISALKAVIGITNDNLYKSYIVFSERCNLKKTNVNSKNVKVLKRNQLINQLKNDIKETVRLLSSEQIENIYNKIKRNMHVDDKIKKDHIENVNKRKNC